MAAVAVGVCLAVASCGDSSKKPGCKADKDCKNHQVCGDGKCVECNIDAQCPGGKRCSAHACVLAPECISDKQCPGGKVCQAGKCKACATDSECGKPRADPAVSITAAVSLMLRPSDNTTPVAMPGKAERSTTAVTICQRVLPRP